VLSSPDLGAGLRKVAWLKLRLEPSALDTLVDTKPASNEKLAPHQVETDKGLWHTNPYQFQGFFLKITNSF